MTLTQSANPPVCWPETLFETVPDIQAQKTWWIVRTKSRHEKSLAWQLKAQKINYFLPLVTKAQKCQNRMRTSIVPLFSGYMFFQGDLSDRQDVLRTNRVAQILEVADHQKLHGELTALSVAIKEKMNMELYDFVSKGQMVTVTAGPFKGMKGIVTKIKNKQRVIIRITEMKQAVAVELGLEMVL